MGAMGSDAAIEAADVVLMDDKPSNISRAIRVARKTMSIVWQNIIFALGIKLLILVLAALGIANMWLAVFGDVGVAIIAILNARSAMGGTKLWCPCPARPRPALTQLAVLGHRLLAGFLC